MLDYDLPALADVRAWLGVPATVLDDAQLAQVLDAEAAIQGRQVTIPRDDLDAPYLTADLVQALYRRVGREIAAKGVPLGVVGVDAEYGPTRLTSWDAEIDRLEASRRRFVFA